MWWGVISISSSSRMNSMASSRDIFLEGFILRKLSEPEARMLVSFFSLVALTSMSSSRAFSPTIMPL